MSDFDALNTDEAANALPLAITAPGGTPVFNLALARVHMNSETIASNVRVFFRSCRASVTSATYGAQGPTTGPSYIPAFYRSNPATGPSPGSSDDNKIPLLGVTPVTPPNGGAATLEYTAIPFFATARVNVADPTQSMLGQQDTPNVRDIQAASGNIPAVALRLLARYQSRHRCPSRSGARGVSMGRAVPKSNYHTAGLYERSPSVFDSGNLFRRNRHPPRAMLPALRLGSRSVIWGW